MVVDWSVTRIVFQWPSFLVCLGFFSVYGVFVNRASLKECLLIGYFNAHFYFELHLP